MTTSAWRRLGESLLRETTRAGERAIARARSGAAADLQRGLRRISRAVDRGLERVRLSGLEEDLGRDDDDSDRAPWRP